MKIQQLSIFAENKPGHLAAPAACWRKTAVDLRALTVADTQHFGILRMLVKDADKARAVLEKPARWSRRPRCWPSRWPISRAAWCKVLGARRIAAQHRVRLRRAIRTQWQGRAHLPLQRSRQGRCSDCAAPASRCCPATNFSEAA
jgi:hypothetical protein